MKNYKKDRQKHASDLTDAQREERGYWNLLIFFNAMVLQLALSKIFWDVAKKPQMIFKRKLHDLNHFKWLQGAVKRQRIL